METITFLLAVVGYAGLAATAVLVARGPLPLPLWRATAIVITTHVALIWMFRYQWRLSEATRDGYVGFLVFHGALTLTVASLFVRERTARTLVHVTFGIITLGALGAVFRYDVVAPYRPVVIAVAALGVAGIARAWLFHAK